MNHVSLRFVRFASILLVGATTFFMSGCGPQDIDDPSYLDSAINDADKDAGPTEEMPTEGAPQMGPDANKQPEMNMPPQEGAPAVVGAPAVAVAPTPVIQLPDAFVKLPSQAVHTPPAEFNTEEDINYQRRVLHQRDIHRFSPTIENHLVRKNLLTHNQYQTNIINHPSFARRVAFASTAAVSAEVLPTTEITVPTVTYGTAFVGGIGVAPGCAPWLSGGFYRRCGGAGPLLP